MADKKNEDISCNISITLECTSVEEDPFVLKVPFHSPPFTVADIKAQVQAVYQIPISSQTILLNSTAPLDSSLELSLLGLKNEDTLTVQYFSPADCNDLDQCMKWLGRIVQVLKRNGVPRSSDVLTKEMTDALNDGNLILRTLAFKLFIPWLTPRTYLNKLYFIENGGLDMLMELNSLLSRYSWYDLMEKLQVKKQEILSVLSNLAEGFAFIREIVKRGGLENCVETLLQVSLDGYFINYASLGLMKSVIGTLSK